MLIKDIRVGVTQKINLGNFETRDISLEASASLSEEEAIVFTDKIVEIRSQLLELQKEYYVSTKDAISGITGAIKDITRKIEKAKTGEELKTLRPDIEAIKDERAKNSTITLYNDKLLELSSGK
jgi:predicted  nucleic acid-binding Zn-ribbon protein